MRGFGFGLNKRTIIGFYNKSRSWVVTVFNLAKAYVDRVTTDSGTVEDITEVKSYWEMADKNDMLDSIEFAWLGEAGTKVREDGIYSYVEKLYDIYNFNDATQTTASSQPYISGNIAPNEKLSLKNPNGDSRYVTHPEISFSATDEWSVTTVWNDYSKNGLSSDKWRIVYGNNAFDGLYCGRSGGPELRFDDGTFVLLLSSTNYVSLIGTQLIFTLVKSSGGTYAYLNGIEVYSGVARSLSATFNALLDNNRLFWGTISAHIIRSQALTPEQVAAEHAVLRELYPEIPSVKIGDYNVATSALEMVASTNGTVITQATDNTDWQTGAARWCYHSDDIQTGAIFGKIYNKAARDIIIANPPEGWHVATEAELTALATYNEALIIGGTDYWTANIGTNTTGFTAIGGASRNSDGTFNTLKESVSFWCADSDKVLNISNTGTAIIETATANEGHYIRLIQDN